MEETEQNHTGVFVPAGGNYFSEYPELKEIPEFAHLTEPEMRFVFYHYNPSSPFANLKTADRFVRSRDLVFTNGSSKQAFAPTAIPEHIVAAGERMSRVNFGLRSQADVVVKQMFRNLNTLVQIDEKSLSGMTIDEKKKYVSMAKEATETLTEMIYTMECGFGLRPAAKRGPRPAEQDEDEKETTPKKKTNLADLAIEQSKNK